MIGMNGRNTSTATPNTTPQPTPQVTIRRVAARDPGDVAGSQEPTRDRLPGYRDGVEREGEQTPQLRPDLVRGYLGVAHPGCEAGADDEYHPQTHGTDEEPEAGGGGCPQSGEVGSDGGAVPSRTADHDDHIDRRAARLGQYGPDGRSGDSPAQAEDEGGVQPGVDDEHSHRHAQRGPGVLQSTEHTGPRQNDQHRRDAEEADVQIRLRLWGDRSGGTKSVDDARGERPADGDDADTDRGREPDAVDTLPYGRGQVAGTDLASHGRCGAVCEEDTEVNESGERLAGDSEATELGGAEMADDRGVRQQEKGLGHERTEGGHREAKNLTVVRVPQPHCVLSFSTAGGRCSRSSEGTNKFVDELSTGIFTGTCTALSACLHMPSTESSTGCFA